MGSASRQGEPVLEQDLHRPVLFSEASAAAVRIGAMAQLRVSVLSCKLTGNRAIGHLPHGSLL
jgi:hypothetical protein